MFVWMNEWMCVWMNESTVHHSISSSSDSFSLANVSSCWRRNMSLSRLHPRPRTLPRLYSMTSSQLFNLRSDHKSQNPRTPSLEYRPSTSTLVVFLPSASTSVWNRRRRVKMKRNSVRGLILFAPQSHFVIYCKMFCFAVYTFVWFHSVLYDWVDVQLCSCMNCFLEISIRCCMPIAEVWHLSD